MSRTDQKLLETARARFKAAAESEGKIREAALEDFRFRVGEQWPDQVKSARESDGRPALTINRIPQFLRQVNNEQRLSRPSVQVNPVDSGADVETAEVLQGLTRHIEVASDAEAAYDTAFENATTGGFGWFRVVTEFCDPTSFDQDIRIKRVENPFTVYIDPAATAVDRSDMKWAFVVDDIPADDYKAQYPDSLVASMEGFASVGDGSREWFASGNVRVAEYFHVEEERATLCLLADGSTAFEDEAGELEVVRRRSSFRRRILWEKMNGVEVLERAVWAGRWIPLVPVLGDEVIVDGERHLIGMVRFARDAQRMYNYWVSAATETIALAPKAPFIGVEGQFEGHEEQWKQANSRSFAYLEYRPKSVSGEPAPPPQRNFAEPPIQAIMVSIRQADNDLKATMGIYDASLGQSGSESSGRAILARQRESDTANANFGDNLARAIKHCGRILIDLIPMIYDAPRIVRILRPDQSSEMVQLNQPFQDGSEQRIYDLSVGKYDVTVSVGPSYQTQRQESVASMVELARTDPRLMQVAGDLVVGSMDWQGAKEIAKRLKTLLPPELREEASNESSAELPVGVQQQMALMAQQVEELTAELTAAMEALDGKRIEAEGRAQVAAIQADSRERIAALQAQVELVTTEARVNADSAHVVLRAELAAIQARLATLPQLPVEGEQILA